MPRLRPDGIAPAWDALYRAAAPQGGFFTTSQAHEVGYSGALLAYHERIGHLEHAARGIFRLTNYPPGEQEDLIVTWLWSERVGVFSHETALALHELSDALPSRHHLGVPMSWSARRLRVPMNVILHHGDVPKRDIAWAGPVPVTTPLRTVVDCTLAHVEPDLVRQAKAQAQKRGLFTAAELKHALATATAGESAR